MRKLISIDPVTIIATVVNILILMVAVRIFLFKPVNKILSARQAEADAGLDEIEAKKEEASQLKQQYEESMKGIDETKNETIAEARKKASAEYDRIVTDANDKAKDIVDKAKKDAEIEKAKILEKADSEIADLVINATAKVLNAKADPENDKALYDQFIKQAGK